MIKNEIKNIISLAGNSIIKIDDLNSYIDKIYLYSTILSVVEQGTLQGFISYYNNDVTKENAFLTLIAIHPKFQGKSLGKKLLAFSIEDLKQKKFKNYSLEVLKSNETAITLYKNFGFKIIEETESLWIMKLEL